MKLFLSATVALATAGTTTASSIKMDFLHMAHVRTDPIVNPTSLSDHVHTFYGATEVRPETTYEDLRNAYGNSGNVEENKSLYWHPTIYKVDQATGVKTIANTYVASAYYIWTPGVAQAFPDGFKMIAFIPEEEANGFFPEEPEDELETEIWFPDCWDGVNIDSDDHMSHVAYSSNRDVDGTCPESHPVKIPKIEFFVRVAPYEGGPHIFADGTTRLHADYFSGWDENFLQGVLDNCDNGSFESARDFWCEDHLTFLDTPKEFRECDTLNSFKAKLEPYQPNPIDTTAITTEAVDGIVDLPRGEDTGMLLPRQPGPPATLPPAPTIAPADAMENCEEAGGGEEEEEEDGDEEEGEGEGEGEPGEEEEEEEEEEDPEEEEEEEEPYEEEGEDPYEEEEGPYEDEDEEEDLYEEDEEEEEDPDEDEEEEEEDYEDEEYEDEEEYEEDHEEGFEGCGNSFLRGSD